MRYAYGVTAALLLGGAATILAIEPLGAQDVANARYDPGRWAGGFPGTFAPLPRRLRAAPNMDPNQIACAHPGEPRLPHPRRMGRA